ncbi:hypothetical protein PCAR4_210152 [Paraburkholderia caribensis]|nr:hypothetical protein PCAR4_210152 [Paraburkholderia caribensis]
MSPLAVDLPKNKQHTSARLPVEARHKTRERHACRTTRFHGLESFQAHRGRMPAKPYRTPVRLDVRHLSREPIRRSR